MCISMTVPPNTLAALSIWTMVWLSSRFNKRAPFIIGSAGVAIIGSTSLDAFFFFDGLLLIWEQDILFF